MKLLSLVIISLSFLTLLVGCQELFCPGQYKFYQDNPFGFRLYDKDTGENLLKIGKNIYDEDTVKIYNTEGEVVYPGPVQKSGRVSFDFIDREKDEGVTNQFIDRRFLLYLDHQDTDTLDITFKTGRDNCDRQVVNYFKVAYNDSVYFDEPTEGVYNRLIFYK